MCLYGSAEYVANGAPRTSLRASGCQAVQDEEPMDVVTMRGVSKFFLEHLPMPFQG
jgi:hypothetical protein